VADEKWNSILQLSNQVSWLHARRSKVTGLLPLDRETQRVIEFGPKA